MVVTMLVCLYVGKWVGIKFDFEILGKRVYIDNTPKVGGLILFPTWVPHYTTRNVSDGARISISGNYFPILF